MAPGVIRMRILHQNEHPLRVGEAFSLWREDENFPLYFSSLLSGLPFEAYFWEMPPVTRDSLDQAFEFVLVESPRLADVRADYGAFKHYFSAHAPDGVVGFHNLGRDTYLIAPCPGEESAYAHLAVFSRLAPPARQQSLWRRVGREIAARLGEEPLWVSTSGLGVHWLHVRLDRVPKYYTWRPYAAINEPPSRVNKSRYA